MGPCDLAQLVQRVVDQRLLTASRQIELHTSMLTLPVLANADRVGQVITNYLTNALKYAEESRPVEIHLSIQRSMAHVAVQDRGPGLTPEQQQHLWARSVALLLARIKDVLDAGQHPLPQTEEWEAHAEMAEDYSSN